MNKLRIFLILVILMISSLNCRNLQTETLKTITSTEASPGALGNPVTAIGKTPILDGTITSTEASQGAQ
jgi:hypothetical protein